MGEFSISTLIYLSLEKLATDEVHFNPLFSDGKIVRDAIWNMAGITYENGKEEVLDDV